VTFNLLLALLDGYCDGLTAAGIKARAALEQADD